MFLPPMRSRSANLVLVLALAAFAQSQTTESEGASVWNKPAHDIVQQVLEVAGTPASVSFEVDNRSGLSPSDLQQIRGEIEQELRAAKIKVVRMDSAVAEIRFVLSRNARGLLWIARVKQGTSEEVSMLELPDPTIANVGGRPTLFRLERTLLLTRSTQMLDVAVGDNFLMVLGGEQITLYPRANVNATAAGSVPVTHATLWPRDLRGRLFLHGEGFTAYLPGVRCTGTVRPSFTGQCSPSDDPWPLLRPTAGEAAPSAFFANARNHFSGVLAGSLAAASVPPFFSAARLGESADALWGISGTDGLTRLYIRMEATQPPIRTVTSLGSDLAAIQSGCGTGWQLLVTGDGDGNAPDGLQAFEIRNRDATAVTEKLSFDGPITGLWPGATGAAIAIVRHPGKESYEAYSVSITCGR